MNGNDEQPDTSSVYIKDSGISGNVAGRDINIFEDRGPEELIQVLEYRAKTIESDLEQYYKYDHVREYLDKFHDLHKKHIRALENQQYILAHDILSEIHDISYSLEKNEFWKENENTNIHYMTRGDAFTRGRLICEYVAGDLVKESSYYPSINHPLWSNQLSGEFRSELPKSPYRVMVETSEFDNISESEQIHWLNAVRDELTQYKQENEKYNINYFYLEEFYEFSEERLSVQFPDTGHIRININKALAELCNRNEIEYMGGPDQRYQINW